MQIHTTIPNKQLLNSFYFNILSVHNVFLLMHQCNSNMYECFVRGFSKECQTAYISDCESG